MDHVQFRKPGEISKAILEDRNVDAQSENTNAQQVYNNPYTSLSMQQQRQRLPIYKNRSHILYLLERYQTIIIVGETGCGKSTQIPQYLLELEWTVGGKIIGITQPRRVAVITLANRVAEERGMPLGAEVGYSIRFDNFFDPSTTKIKFMTDGLLLREFMGDPLLTQYSVIMVDEAHERTLYSDIILGLLRKVIVKRPDLKIIVASATLEAEEFRDYFNMNKSTDSSHDTATIMSVEGRMYPVQIFYAKSPVPDYVKATVNAVLKLHRNEPVGDILAFLTGQDEVEMVVHMLKEESNHFTGKMDKLWVLPMYGALPAREQLKVFNATGPNQRKVVIATNIAEASLTIPGIVYVVDCGFVKLRVLNHKSGIESLMVVPISQASATQRAGRAGRLRAGKAYRLYPEDEYFKLPLVTVPEMQRSNLAPVILQLKAMGIDNVLRFHFLARPPAYAMVQGMEILYALGALDSTGQLTKELGFQMAEFPLPPMHAKALLSSGDYECAEEMLTIIAMLQVNDVFLQPPGQKNKADMTKRSFSVEEGDHLTLLNVYTAFNQFGRTSKWCGDNFVNYRGLCRASEIRDQLMGFLKRYKIKLNTVKPSGDQLRRCLVCGFFAQAAKLHYTGIYHTIKEHYPLKVHQGSVLMFRDKLPEWIIFNEVMQDSMRDITVIEPQWLYELAPHYYEYGTEHELAAKRARAD